MKQIIIAATMMAITTGAFAQTQNDEDEDYETTEGTFCKYMVYTNDQLSRIMRTANHMARLNGIEVAACKVREGDLWRTKPDDRSRMLALYQRFLNEIPEYMEAAEKQVLYASASGGF